MSKRFSFIKAGAALCMAAAVFCLTATSCSDSKKVFTIFSWAEMFPQEILDDFEKATGYVINYQDFTDDEFMLTALEQSKGRHYDLIIADDYIIQAVIEKGLAQKLDTKKIANYGNINPIYQKQFYDPTDEYTVPYGAGVQTIMYDPAHVNINITGYADLWDASLRDRLGIIANYRVINGMALKVLGKSYNTENLDDIRAAGEKLLDLAPNIRLIKDDQIQDDLLSGEIHAAVMYTSEVTQAKMANDKLEFVYPSEGIGFGIMAGFIPSKAPNPNAAYAFLDYILDAQRGAECFEHLGYYSTYSASDPLISEEYKEFLTLPEGFNVNMEMIQIVSPEADEEHSQAWTAFKSAAGK